MSQHINIFGSISFTHFHPKNISKQIKRLTSYDDSIDFEANRNNKGIYQWAVIKMNRSELNLAN